MISAFLEFLESIANGFDHHDILFRSVIYAFLGLIAAVVIPVLMGAYVMAGLMWFPFGCIYYLFIRRNRTL